MFNISIFLLAFGIFLAKLLRWFLAFSGGQFDQEYPGQIDQESITQLGWSFLQDSTFNPQIYK